MRFSPARGYLLLQSSNGGFEFTPGVRFQFCLLLLELRNALLCHRKLVDRILSALGGVRKLVLRLDYDQAVDRPGLHQGSHSGRAFLPEFDHLVQRAEAVRQHCDFRLCGIHRPRKRTLATVARRYNCKSPFCLGSEEPCRLDVADQFDQPQRGAGGHSVPFGFENRSPGDQLIQNQAR